MDRRLPRTADLLAARPAPSPRPARRVRRRARQPDAGLRPVGRTSARPSSPRSTTPSPSTGSWSWTPREGRRRRLSVRRWYAFTRMQKRVARRLPSVLTVSGTSRQEIVDHLGVRDDRIHVVHIGADTDLFSPDPSVPRCRAASSPPPARTSRSRGSSSSSRRSPRSAPSTRPRTSSSSASAPRTGPSPRPSSGTASKAPSSFVKGITDAELVDLVRSRRGRLRALPVRGLLAARGRGHGHRHPAGRHHRRGDPRGRRARRRDLPRGAPRRRGRAGRRARPDSWATRELRARLGAAGRERVLGDFTWARAAPGTAAHYRESIARSAGRTPPAPRPPPLSATCQDSDRESRATC